MAHAYLNARPLEVLQRCRKISWESRRAAFMARGRARQATGVTDVGQGTLKVYKCPICKGWHLGHS